MTSRPLADEIRPTGLDEVVGQEHILGQGRMLRRIIESGQVSNMVFYGPSGTGKTTVAGIIARRTNRRLYKLNATSASLADVKEIIRDADTLLAPEGILLYLDEIQYFNKKQQQSLLEYMENGKITLIASTTDNPYFCVYNALLSRSTVIAMSCGGDVRKGINAVELLFSAAPIHGGRAEITMEDAREVSQRSAMRYDRDGDEHYDILSALMKSLRGSDPDAALHYLARILEAGDLLPACRRILCSACEDIGLAYPQAIPIVKACVDAAIQLGLPEARLPLADAVILLANSPKSNSGCMGIDAAIRDVRRGKTGPIPRELQNVHADGTGFEREQGYLYPHNFPNHYVKQQYLPDALKDVEYYKYGDNKTEQAFKAYWDKIKGGQ